MVDPYFEKMTPQYQVKRQLISIWPSVYKATNFIVTTLFNTLIEMIKSGIRAFKP